jgi:HAE1 family hydrophobic/amphiphilic exporter-1
LNGERSIVLAGAAPARRQHGEGGRRGAQAAAALPGAAAVLDQDPARQRPLASIRDALHDVNFTLALTVVLVVLVIFLFLHRATATAIPAVSLPISLIGARAAVRVLATA